MTVESNYVIAIATLSDWLKNVRQFSTNENQSRLYTQFFPRFEQVTADCKEF